MNKYRQLDLFTLELGIALCQEASLNSILKTITSIRGDIFEQYGVVIPSIRVKDNKSLSPFEYVIKVSGLETARYELKKDSLLILDLGNVTSKMRGTKTKDPTYGLPGIWISSARKEDAKEKGYFIVSHEKLIRALLFEEIKKNLAEVITSQYVEDLLNEIIVSNRALCDQLARKHGAESVSIIKEVLKALLKDEVNITDIISILETIANSAKTNCENIDWLVEKCRVAIAPYIISPLMTDGNLNLIPIGINFSNYILDHSKDILSFSYDRKILGQFRNELLSILDNLEFTPVIVCFDRIRKEVSFIINELALLPGIKVITDKELAAVRNRIHISNAEVIATVGETLPIDEVKSSEQKSPKVETTQSAQKSQLDKKNAYAILQKQLKTILDKLPEQEREVISMRFGLDGNGSHTLEEIGMYFNLTREEIRGIEARALRLLRKEI